MPVAWVVRSSSPPLNVLVLRPSVSESIFEPSSEPPSDTEVESPTTMPFSSSMAARTALFFSGRSSRPFTCPTLMPLSITGAPTFSPSTLG